MASEKPWKRKNPKRSHAKLTAASKAEARARARRAGRRYPNLVDNMNAAKKQTRGVTKRTRAASKRTRGAK